MTPPPLNSTLKMMVITAKSDVFILDPSSGSATALSIPFPTDFTSDGVATTDGTFIYLLFTQHPNQPASQWFVASIDVQARTLVRGLSQVRVSCQ